jgi:hypothetical protein
MAYFTGPKKVEWTPIAKIPASSRPVTSPLDTPMPCHASNSPAAPISMIPISHSLTQRMITALSRVSANCPETADSSRKGMISKVEAIAEK